MNLPAHWTDETIDIHGSTFHYVRTGDGSKPALVLTHGFSDNGLCWARFALELESTFDIFLPDARGHGRSARVQPGEVFDRTTDLADLLHALRLDRPLVGGHSMGAVNSAQLAARHPDLVRALVLEDPAWFEDDPVMRELKPRPHLAELAGLAGTPAGELVAQYRARHPNLPDSEIVPWATSKAEFDQNLLRAAAAPAADWRETAAAIRCPALLITGEVERGGIVTPASAAQAAGLNPLIRTVAIPGAGHNVRRSNYAAFRAALLAFLSEFST